MTEGEGMDPGSGAGMTEGEGIKGGDLRLAGGEL